MGIGANLFGGEIQRHGASFSPPVQDSGTGKGDIGNVMKTSLLTGDVEKPVRHQQTVREAIDAWRNEGNPN